MGRGSRKPPTGRHEKANKKKTPGFFYFPQCHRRAAQ
jgi:hypothetical protein